MVGSRDRSEEDGEFACRVGEHCASEGIAVISGAAKGIDRDAMSSALEAGGWTVGVLAEGLGKTATSGQYRSGLVSDRLTLVSPYDPDSRWFAYAAMERNKLLYGLSDAALIVASSADAGGTWAGATEALQNGRVKVFVKSTGTVATGNLKLLRMGGIPFPAEPWENLRSLLIPPRDGSGHLSAGGAQQLAPPPEPRADRENPTPRAFPFALAESTDTETTPPGAPKLLEQSPQPVAGESVREAYALVIDELLAILKKPQSEEWLAGKMNVRTGQMKDWLDRAVREGRIKKLKRPVRYVGNSPILFTG